MAGRQGKARQGHVAMGKSCAKSVGGSTTYSFPHHTLAAIIMINGMITLGRTNLKSLT